ncbi:MAG: phage terminase large subunit family protein [Candidatus Thermoplasmatota archaeon]|nr:phage terminase large subunit family protein [Candidatus Thermoplasmatota archaeon]
MKMLVRCKRCGDFFQIEKEENDIIRVDLLPESETLCPRCKTELSSHRKPRKM